MGACSPEQIFSMIGVKAVIEFKDVTKVYDSNGTKALDNVNIKIIK